VRPLSTTLALLLSFTLLSSTTARAEPRPFVFPDGVTHTPAWWHLALVTGKVSERALVWAEVQPRASFDMNPRLDRLIVRGALGFAITDELSLWGGVGLFPGWSSWAPDDVVPGELRLFEQLLFTTKFGAFTLQSRSRLEQRLDSRTPPSSTSDIGHRARTFLRGAFALDDARQFSVVAWDEVFVHLGLTPGATPLAFDQNRAFAGVSYRPFPSLALEAGVLNATVLARDGTIGMTHGLYTFSVYTLP